MFCGEVNVEIVQLVRLVDVIVVLDAKYNVGGTAAGCKHSYFMYEYM